MSTDKQTQPEPQGGQSDSTGVASTTAAGGAVQAAGALQVDKLLAQVAAHDDPTKGKLYKTKLAEAKEGPSKKWQSAAPADEHHEDEPKKTAGQTAVSNVKDLGKSAALGAATGVLSSSNVHAEKGLLHEQNKLGHVDVLDASARAGHLLSVGAKGVAVNGNAGATLTLIGGVAQLTTKPLEFDFYGEQVFAEFVFELDPSVVADIGGNLGVDVGWHGATATANVYGFSGVKGLLSATGRLSWNKKPAAQYANEMAKSGSWRDSLSHFLPSFVLNTLPSGSAGDWFVRKFVSSFVSPDAGKVLGFGAKCAVEGSEGVGAQASLDAEFEGGVFKWHGKAGVTFGFGAGFGVDLMLGAKHGIALMGVAAMRGASEAFSDLHTQSDIRNALFDHAKGALTKGPT